MATTASVYNFSRTNRQILRRHRKDRPSLVLHLHNSHFRFERQNGMFLFDSPVKAFLQYIRDQRVPADLVDVLTDSGVQFFEGCLIVEVHDHRSHNVSLNSALPPSQLHSLSNGSSLRQPRPAPGGSATASGSASSTAQPPSLFYLREGGRYGARNLIGGGGPSGSSLDGKFGALAGIEIYRIVLHPTSETLWSDLKMLDDMTGGIWSDQEALEVEAKILSLTAPPLCLSPDPQASRIANLMLSSTAPPSAYAPSSASPLPFHRNASKKRGANSIEMEKEEASRQRREKIMRMMEGGLRTVPSAAKPPDGSALAAVAPVNAQAAAAASKAFVPTFGRMAFIEKWRMGRNLAADPHAASGTASGTKDDSGKTSGAAAKGDKAEPAKKPPAKKKKKAQREKEEAEAAAAAAAAAAAEAKKKEEEAAAAAKKDTAATTGKPLSKKKKAQLAKEEKERKEKEEKEKAEKEKEEKEKKEKDQAAAAAPAKKSKSKKKKDEGDTAAGGGTAANGAANGDKGSGAAKAGTSPTKGKADAATPAKADATTTGATAGKKPTPAKKPAAKKPAASKASKAKTSPTKTNTSAAKAGTDPTSTEAPAMSAATPASIQSTPTLSHAMPNVAQQQQQQQVQAAMFMQQQQQQQQANGMNAGPFYGLPMMNNGSAGMFAPNGVGMGGPGLAGMMPGVSMGTPQAGNMAATMMGGAPGMGMGMMPTGSQQGQPGVGNNGGGFMNGAGGYPGLPHGVGMMPQQQQQQPGQPQGNNLSDLPVGVGLAGLGNWGNSS
ncbi:uncharacterized protein PFL1_00969 [Pseudozyma flocculosa PF-1]|uniref:Spt20-like SEP domain-containing protein n=1 Tax=Pseudozyma flocculosa TaxID=84751 RepID=A0A5C3F967_9BASI|nr:uncharacterized protein PFL1_00969 [Pseudozyma flocculosa PF-1]EPQ31636.1 hypothetical protein PFL1_00969 [Pseudozyma flocculosa PF-1]SPO40750.1 uncharacterized protein PSFLO_06232 [Pseudozyma flocculosa]